MKASSNHGFVNHLLLYTLVGLGLSGSVGLGSVWMQHQISVAANANKALEAQIAAVERQSEQFTTEIAEEQDAVALLQRNSAWRLGLVAPAPGQIQFVAGDPRVKLMSKHNQDLIRTEDGHSSDRPDAALRPIVLRLGS